jgi:hypothetical protein
MEAKRGEAGDCVLAPRKALIVKGGEIDDWAATSVFNDLDPVHFARHSPDAPPLRSPSREGRRHSLPEVLFFRKTMSRGGAARCSAAASRQAGTHARRPPRPPARSQGFDDRQGVHYDHRLSRSARTACAGPTDGLARRGLPSARATPRAWAARLSRRSRQADNPTATFRPRRRAPRTAGAERGERCGFGSSTTCAKHARTGSACHSLRAPLTAECCRASSTGSRASCCAAWRARATGGGALCAA